ncbi:hypothetical protein L915_00750 [Phytophthora nicotianae]|uniref:MULE transposase domain-containing protein n=1 Tax=Phytophthora nicotianae TaxID=4792 RepID=W2HQ45_PHYNI|nr:hypothetical protein L915_00750 [Phytophthora nicotianae]
MKHPLYNGVCVLLFEKDGDWYNIPPAIGFIHKETAENFAWFIANCVASGLKLDDKALFTDCGRQHEAQKLLEGRGVVVNLTSCGLHIVFNVCDHFRSRSLL